jgi:hypothetical protein
VAAGKHSASHKGTATNRLCLTLTPEYDNRALSSTRGYLFGGEYEYISGHHDHDVPCALCLASQPVTVMIAGTFTCPSGWTFQYSGHLSSDRYDLFASEFICLDQNLENLRGGVGNYNGNAFVYVQSVCGSLPCPLYRNDSTVTCVVCSK